MRSEPWMNRTPTPQRTPYQLAQADLTYWSGRERALLAQLADAQKERVAASERLEQLEREAAHKSA